MSKKILFSLAASAAVGVGIWIAINENHQPTSQASQLTKKATPSKLKKIITPSSVDEVDDTLMERISNSQLHRLLNKDKRVSVGHSKKHEVLELLNEVYLDPKSEASRRRVRIIKTNFKYPHLKLEEIVTTDPASGKKSVITIKNSVADHLTVGIKDGQNVAELAESLEQAGYTIRKSRPSYVIVEIDDFTNPQAQNNNILKIESMGGSVLFAESDNLRYASLTPNDPGYPSLYGQNNTGQTGGVVDADFDAPEAWDTRTDASNIVVAISDSGVNHGHEDLAPNMWRNPIDNRFGIDAVDNDGDPDDENGHGSHVAGTVGARGNNGIGVVGVAWNVQLMACRGLNALGSGTSTDLADTIIYAYENGANIVNASWGGGGPSQLTRNAIQACSDRGIAFIAAAGNDTADNDRIASFPNGYQIPNVVSVASLDDRGRLSIFSNFGANTVDIGAPGTNILSTWFGPDDAYETISGTSMASPQVAGAMALCYAHFPNLTMEEKIGRLFCSVESIADLEGVVSTGGRLNLNSLLTADLSLKNDNFADAFQEDARYVSWRICNLMQGTREADEDSFSQAGTGDNSVWQTWTATYNGSGIIKGSASSAPVRVILYEGGDRANLVELYDSKDNEGFNPKKEFTIPFSFTTGTKYTILLDTDRTDSNYIPAKTTVLAFPTNDLFRNAIELNGPTFTATGVSINATAQHWELTGSRDANAVSHGASASANSLWWKWTSTFDGEMTFSSHATDATTNSFASVVAVYTGTPNKASGDWTKVSDDTGLESTKSVQVVEGTTYYIAVDGIDEGDITLSGNATTATLATIASGNGTITTSSGATTFFLGQTAQLTATPASGWTFAGWVGVNNASGNTADVLMATDRTVTASFTQSLDAWKAAHLNGQTTLTANSDDADSDNISNIQEYLHGSDPMDPNSTGILTSQSDNNCICITYTRRQGSQSPYAIGSEASLDMSSWSTANIIEEIVSTQNGIETVNAKLPLSSGTNGFIRIKYTGL